MNAESRLRESMKQLGDQLEHSNDVLLLLVTDMTLQMFKDVDLEGMEDDARERSLDAMQRAVDELLKLS